jgi:hypothetical protein
MAVELHFRTDLSGLSPGHIQMYLEDYGTQIANLAELATEWDELDGEERMHYEAEFDLALGRRLVLRELEARRGLTEEQHTRLRRADALARQRAALIERLFGAETLALLFPRQRTPATVHGGETSPAAR